MRNNHPIISGRSLGGSIVELESYREDNVASAYYQRKWLVKLMYAKQNVIVAINSCEAKTGFEAVEVAHKRAQAAYRASKKYILQANQLQFGNLIEATFLPDCLEARERFGVAGPRDPEISHMNMRAS